MYHSEEVLEDINGSFTSLRTEKCPAALKRSDATAHENMLMISESGLDHPRRIPIPFWHIWSSDPEHWLYWSWNLWKPAGATVKWFKSRPWKHHFHPPLMSLLLCEGQLYKHEPRMQLCGSPHGFISMDVRINKAQLRMLLLGQVNVQQPQ